MWWRRQPPKTGAAVETVAADLSAPGVAASLIAKRPDLIFHLAAIVSGEAEADFEKGYRINLDGTRYLLEAIRLEGGKAPYLPRLVFTSSIAVFGAPFPDAISDEFFSTPLTSYGTQKAISELLLDDYSRKGFLDGIAIRLPTIVVRPGKPNAAASGVLLQHPARTAERTGSRALGRQGRAALVREPARRGRLPAACGNARHQPAGLATDR